MNDQMNKMVISYLGYKWEEVYLSLLDARRKYLMNLLKAEFAGIVRDKKLLIPIVAVLFVPILYAGMFLWAFWDPYERLDDLPVAIVNEDEGAIFEGTELELGDELVSKLEENKDFDFHFVSWEEGSKGLEQQKYYMLVEIPENFSENATTLLDDHPKKLDLTYIPNESYNFLSSQIGETAILKIQTSLQEKITETYAETMFDKIVELADGMEQASDGAEKVSDGVSKVNDGSEELKDNLQLLAEKSLEFNNGIGKVNQGSQDLVTGAGQLSSGLNALKDGQQQLESSSQEVYEGNKRLADGISETKEGLTKAQETMPQLLTGTEQLATGSRTLASGLKRWQENANDVAVGAEQVNTGISMLNKQLQQILPALPSENQAVLIESLQQLEAGSSQVVNGVKGLSQAATPIAANATNISEQLLKVNEGQHALQQGMNQLADGAQQLENGSQAILLGQQQFQSGIHLFGKKLTEAADGSTALARGSKELSNGVGQLASGSGGLTEGTSQLADGSRELTSGTTELLDGATELASKLADGADQVSSVNGDKSTYEMMAKPVEVEQEKLNEVPNYGTGFSPYFLSLGLFVGALLLSIVFPLTEPMAVPRSGLNWFTSKFVILVGIGVIQALLAVALLLFGLKLEVRNIPLFVLFAIVTSLTFIALIQFLVTLFDNPGRFIAIIILIMQLTTSAGTFPLELIPNVLQPFNKVLPMTYTVQGFKAVISSGDFGFMWQNVIILLIFTIACIVGTLGYFNFKHKRKFATLQDSAT